MLTLTHKCWCQLCRQIYMYVNWQVAACHQLTHHSLTQSMLDTHAPGIDMLPTSGTTISVPTKSHRSPACAVSTASALRMTSTLYPNHQQSHVIFNSCHRKALYCRFTINVTKWINSWLNTVLQITWQKTHADNLAILLNKKPSCRWRTTWARCQLKSSKMLLKCYDGLHLKRAATGELPNLRPLKVTNTGAIR